jgi:hypothetical protein
VRPQYHMKLKCDRKLPLYVCVVKMVCSEDGINKKPKHVANYCKQQGICLPIKLCRMSKKKYFCSHIGKNTGYRPSRIF